VISLESFWLVVVLFGGRRGGKGEWQPASLLLRLTRKIRSDTDSTTTFYLSPFTQLYFFIIIIFILNKFSLEAARDVKRHQF
jgi:hypothetical protein